MKNSTIAILGAGHMGVSLLGGLIANGYPAEHIFLTDPSIDKLEHAKHTFNVKTSTDNALAIQTAKTIIFAVKPDIVSQVAKELKIEIQKQKPLIISIAAGVRESSIQECLGGSIPIVRAMPNTPALIGCGATALYANNHVSSLQHDFAESVLRSVGTVVWLQDEKLMDIVTALSGSGPAYFYLIIEALQAVGTKLGLPRDIAQLLTLQTAYGAARLALESDKSVSDLCQQAMTPGGTTEQAIRTLEENNVRDIIEAAVKAAAKRATELGK